MLQTLKHKKYQYYAVYFIISVLAFYQFVFFIHPPKYDVIDCYYPWRYFIGECLQQHTFPFWNPYQDLGYPIHADPSSGTWYPFVWVIGYCFGYNVYTIGLEIWVHVFIAAIGFYKLCKTLKFKDEVAFLAGLSYMLCGVFIGNAQHITYVISACWIPFLLNYYLRMAEEAHFVNSLKVALFLFLILTGGYPAFTFILFYLLTTFFVYFLSRKIIEKNKAEIIRFLKHHVLLIVVVLALSIGLLMSVYQVIPFLSRANGLTLAKALFCPFTPQSTISFLLPFAAITQLDFYQTDLSMTNAYFGIVLFVFFILGVVAKKDNVLKMFFVFALIALLVSFGGYLPVREFLFNYVPLMNLFRFPSTFRLFVIIGFVLVAANGLNQFLLQEWDNRKKLMLTITSLLLLFVVLIVFSRVSGYLSMADFVRNDLFVFSKTSAIRQHVAFQAGVQLVLLGALLMVVKKVNQLKYFVLLVALIISVDMLLSAQLNAPYTVYYKEFSSSETNTHVKKFPKGFPLLPDTAIASTNPNEMYFGPFWKNVNIFQKQISADGFNSFSFSGREALRDSIPMLYAQVLKNKIVYLSDEIHSQADLPKMQQDSTFTSKSLFFKATDYATLSGKNFQNTAGDIVRLESFEPSVFVVNTNTSKSQVLTLMQNYYTGWEAFINDKPATIYTSNKSLISVVLPAGNNSVSFVYKNKSVKVAAFISVCTLLSLIGILIFYSRKNRMQHEQ